MPPKKKTYRYIEVEGVRMDLLDRCLLDLMTKESLISYLKANSKLRRMIGIESNEINSCSHAELAGFIVPHLLEEYNLYNQLVGIWTTTHSDRLLSQVGEVKDTMDLALWEQKLHQKFKEEEIPLFPVLCHLRFHKAPHFHKLVPTFLDTYWEVNYLKKQEMDSNVSTQIELAKDTLDETNISTEEYLNKIIQMAEVLKSLSGLGMASKEKVEELQAKNEQIEKELANLHKELKAKDKQLKTKDENIEVAGRKVSDQLRRIESLEEKLENERRDKGKLSQLLGESRKNVELLETEKQKSMQKLQLALKENTTIAESVEKRLKTEWNKEKALIGENHLKDRLEQEELIKALRVEIEELTVIIHQKSSREQADAIEDSVVDLVAEEVNKEENPDDLGLDFLIDFQPNRH